MEGDASSIFSLSENTEEIILKDINKFIDEAGIVEIDLMKINIEGAEFALLKSLIKTGNHKKVKNILVQFHKISEYYESSKQAITNELEKTHELVFSYEFIWECWKLK